MCKKVCFTKSAQNSSRHVYKYLLFFSSADNSKKKPTASKDKPHVAKDKPTVAKDKHTAAKEKPVAATNKSMTKKDETSVPKKKPLLNMSDFQVEISSLLQLG